MKNILSILTIFSLFSAVGIQVFATDVQRALVAAPKPSPAFEKALLALSKYTALQKEINIQNSDLAYAMRKALVMAELLVKADGTLDLASCPMAKMVFLSPHPEEYEVNMGRFLDQLKPSWQTVFSKIHLPENANSLLALKALFTQNQSEPLTDWHAKVAVLAAMLAPYNQGPVGDCFAVNTVIRDHEEYFLHAAEDCISIVMNGHIDRPVNGETDSFFFLPTLADDDREMPFYLTLKGTFPNGGDTLFDAPGFAAARTLMGGDEIDTLMADSLKLLAQYIEGNQIGVSPAQVIAAMAEAIAAKIPGANADHLSALGNYAFSSLTNNPILRGVESAFAAMAEDRINDSTRGNINSCIAQALKSTWDSLKTREEAPAFHKAFSQDFNTSYRLLYNLNIPLAQLSSDGHSLDGGFQLYKRVPGDHAELGTKIVTPQEFQELVLDAITATVKELGQTPEIQAIGQILKNVVQTEDFLKNALWAYDPANKMEPDPVKNFQNLSRTPMQSCDGGNPYEVDDIDTGTMYESSVKYYKPENAKDLISWCLTLAKTAPPELLPMDSPQHAFNFTPANPDIKAFLMKEMPTGQWIQNRLIAPGIAVSRKQIDASTAKAIANKVFPLVWDPFSDNFAYVMLVETLSQKTLSIRDYAAALLKGVNNILGSNETQAHQTAVMFDGALLQGLSLNEQAILSQSAIRFAFTNWNQGTDDIYFCAYFNPRTEQVGFGSIFEDKSNLQPMDEDAWVNHQQWDVDLMPAAPREVSSIH